MCSGLFGAGLRSSWTLTGLGIGVLRGGVEVLVGPMEGPSARRGVRSWLACGGQVGRLAVQGILRRRRTDLSVNPPSLRPTEQVEVVPIGSPGA